MCKLNATIAESESSNTQYTSKKTVSAKLELEIERWLRNNIRTLSDKEFSKYKSQFLSEVVHIKNI